MLNYSASGGVLAGDLRMRIGYDVLTEGTPTEYGDAPNVWSRALNVWGKVEELEGEELFRAKQIHAEVKAKVTVRYNASITSAGRFVWQNQYYYPIDVIPDPLKRRMACRCYIRPQESVT
jgi:SPP1 family predicted phage head-tail adaptor